MNLSDYKSNPLFLYPHKTRHIVASLWALVYLIK